MIDVQAPPSSAAGGKNFVKITEVRDVRTFETNPRDPSLQSLGDTSEIRDPKITARAVGRKRGGFGAAFGDVLLPEGKSVAAIVRGAARKALQDKGYTVVEEASPDYAGALPLTVDVERFWAWITPGFAQITVSFTSRVALSGDGVVSASPATAAGNATLGGMAIFESDWPKVIKSGVDDLTARMKEKIRPPPS